jgi:hypothetical protein
LLRGSDDERDATSRGRFVCQILLCQPTAARA